MLEVTAKKGAFKTIRFVQLIEGWANGLTYDEIAAKHKLSRDTMNEYGKALREELDAKDKSEVISKSVARGLITIAESKVSKFILCGLIIMQASSIGYRLPVRSGSFASRTSIVRRTDEA